MPKPGSGAWLALGATAALAVAGAARRGARAKPGEFLYAHLVREVTMARDLRTHRVESVDGTGRCGVVKDGRDLYPSAAEEINSPTDLWIEAHSTRAGPSTPQELLDLLGLNLKAEALAAFGEIPAWALSAATVAKAMREKDLHSFGKCKVFSATLNRWEWIDLQETEPMPTLRGPMQRGWPMGTRDFIWMMLPSDWHNRYGHGRYRNKSLRVKAVTLAKIMSVPERKLVKAAGL